MTTTPTIPPAYRVRFEYDDDPASALHTPEGDPLPGTAEDYAQNEIHALINPADDPVTGARRPVPYEEYCRYFGNPDRHVVLGTIVERQCACCGAWGTGEDAAASLWGIDLMDDAPELDPIQINPGAGHRRDSVSYAADDPAITGYLREVVDDLIAELTPDDTPTAAGGAR